MSNVAVDTVVTIHYRLSLDDGQAVDSSFDGAPLEYLHGHGNIVPGLEAELTGKAVGDSFSVVVPPAEGYGEPDPEGVQEVPRERFPADMELQVGQMLTAEDQSGNTVHFRIVEVGDDVVKVDFNHPLAGKNLNFEIQVLGVRPATQEELQHGHAHGPGGHSH